MLTEQTPTSSLIWKLTSSLRKSSFPISSKDASRPTALQLLPKFLTRSRLWASNTPQRLLSPLLYATLRYLRRRPAFLRLPTSRSRRSTLCTAEALSPLLKSPSASFRSGTALQTMLQRLFRTVLTSTILSL